MLLVYSVRELSIFYTMNLERWRFLLGGCHVYWHLVKGASGWSHHGWIWYWSGQILLISLNRHKANASHQNEKETVAKTWWRTKDWRIWHTRNTVKGEWKSSSNFPNKQLGNSGRTRRWKKAEKSNLTTS